MATLDNLSNLITNAKQTTSGKIEWTDDSLKGIQDEVKYLFTQNGAQVAENVGVLAGLNNDNSQLAIVTEDATLANNGVYFWNLTPVSTINFPAGSNGYWNILEFGVTSAIAAGYIPYSNGSNLVASYLQQTVDEIKMVGGSFVANKSTSTGPYFQAGDTDSIGNDVIFTVNDKTQIIKTNKSTGNKGIYLDMANNLHSVGDKDTRKQLSVDAANATYALADMAASKGLYINSATPVYKLGDYAANTGVVINANNGYIGNPTWGYVYNATTLIAGNSSINLTLDDSANTANLGTSTYGLSISQPFTTSLGDLANGNGLIVDSANETYTLANQTLGKGLFIDLIAETYKLGTYAGYGLSLTSSTGYLGTSTLNYRYTASTVSVGTTSLLLNIDNTAGSVALGSLLRGLSMQIVGGSPTYSFGNLASQIGAFLGQTTGYLGYSTFGYNYTQTTMIAGNASVNLTLDDTTNIATLGTTSLGFKVNVPSSTMNVGDSTKGLFVDILNTTYTLGTASNGLVINTTGAYTLGNGTKGLSLNTTTNTHKLGDYTGNTVFQVQTATGIYKTTVAGLTTGILIDPTTGDFVLGTDIENISTASYFGARGTGGGTPSVVITSDFIDPAGGNNPAEKILVSIPGIGNRWIQLYN
jgi:hypothetical protein